MSQPRTPQPPIYTNPEYQDFVAVCHGWPEQYDPLDSRTPGEIARLRRQAERFLAEYDLTDMERRHTIKVWVE